MDSETADLWSRWPCGHITLPTALRERWITSSVGTVDTDMFQHYRTCGTEHAIARHKLYPFSRKGFTALVGPQNNFRYLGRVLKLGGS
jgi:hypothetical protein